MTAKTITISDYYYKKTEIDTMMNGKADTSHTHTTSEITDFPAIIDRDWQEVTFKSGYSRYNDSTSVYIHRKGNLVELTGLWKPTSTKSATLTPTAFASIPSELAPTRNISTICFGINKHTYMLTVESNGNLKWSRYGVDTSVDLQSSHGAYVHCVWII